MWRGIVILVFALAANFGLAQTPAPAPVAASATSSLETRSPKPETSPSAPDPKDPHSWLWSFQLPGFSDKDYRTAVDGIFGDYERRLGRKLAPGEKRRVGLKVMTANKGLTTSLGLVRAVIGALEARGFKPEEIFIVDRDETKLHEAGFLPLNASEGEGTFDGVQVIALERGRYFSLKWSYDSNAPAPDRAEQAAARYKYEWKITPTDRQSLLPVPLLLAVDFWINLPVGADEGDLGPAGALVNATLFSCSNTERFFESSQIGAKAVAEIAAVPELSRGWVLSLMSLERYQFAGGPSFNSLYSDSAPLLLASPNPVMLDELLYQRVKAARSDNRLPALDRPAYLEYSRLPEAHLGDYDPKRMYFVRLP